MYHCMVEVQVTSPEWCDGLAGMGGFAALETLKTRSSSSPCTTVLEAAMMVPELSEFVATAQVPAVIEPSLSCTCCHGLRLYLVKHSIAQNAEPGRAWWILHLVCWACVLCWRHSAFTLPRAMQLSQKTMHS